MPDGGAGGNWQDEPERTQLFPVHEKEVGMGYSIILPPFSEGKWRIRARYAIADWPWSTWRPFWIGGKVNFAASKAVFSQPAQDQIIQKKPKAKKFRFDVVAGFPSHPKAGPSASKPAPGDSGAEMDLELFRSREGGGWKASRVTTIKADVALTVALNKDEKGRYRMRARRKGQAGSEEDGIVHPWSDWRSIWVGIDPASLQVKSPAAGFPAELPGAMQKSGRLAPGTDGGRAAFGARVLKEQLQGPGGREFPRLKLVSAEDSSDRISIRLLNSSQISLENQLAALRNPAGDKTVWSRTIPFPPGPKTVIVRHSELGALARSGRVPLYELVANGEVIGTVEVGTGRDPAVAGDKAGRTPGRKQAGRETSPAGSPEFSIDLSTRQSDAEAGDRIKVSLRFRNVGKGPSAGAEAFSLECTPGCPFPTAKGTVNKVLNPGDSHMISLTSDRLEEGIVEVTVTMEYGKSRPLKLDVKGSRRAAPAGEKGRSTGTPTGRAAPQ